MNVTLMISGAGITNNSGVTQNLTAARTVRAVAATIEFLNAASAGDNTVLTIFGSTTAARGGQINFHDTSTAGTSSILAEGALTGNEADGGHVFFDGNSTAGNANVTIDGALPAPGFAYGGKVTFSQFSSASDAVFVINSGTGANGGAGTMDFLDNATAANGIFTLNGATTRFGDGGKITFNYGATAANGLFTVNGGQEPDTVGSSVLFVGFDFTGQIVSAGTATIINNGGNGANSYGGYTSFQDDSTADRARLVANGGVNGGRGGFIAFNYGSDGGEAQIEVFGNGYLDVSVRDLPGGTIGSLAGDGFAYLGSRNLTVGSNNLNTTFSGIIQESGGIGGGTGGSVTKIGTGTLTLSGASTYSGGTTVSNGILLVNNSSGSGTGAGAVSVDAGALGGSGIIAGAVTIGTGSGTGAFLESSKKLGHPATLTLQSSLTFNADATYTYTFRANRNRAETDQVIANGVTINSAAMLALSGHTRGTLTQGMVLTLISNTSANPISGTFSNLPDGSIVTINGNNFQVSYSGGDGNDLTLTVVP
jgi:autotransporter-associated beta strand protein